MTPHFAVIGHPIAHSLSPQIHHHFANQLGIALTYDKIQTDAERFATTVTDFFSQGGKGLNITAPFKTLAFDIAHVHTPRSQQAKAANTLWMQEGRLHADTTDGVGLMLALSAHLNLTAKHVLLLGAGGAARSILPALLDAPIASLTLLNRTLSKAQALQADFPHITCGTLTEHASPYDLIIHATSASTIPLPPSLLKPTTVCCDLAYHLHHPTPFTAWAKEQGCFAMDGLTMLIAQAAEAFYIWHGVRPNLSSQLSNGLNNGTLNR